MLSIGNLKLTLKDELVLKKVHRVIKTLSKFLAKTVY